MTLFHTANDLTGKRFGKLIALRPLDERTDNKIVWECRCDCGATTKARSTALTLGHKRSCGCIRSEVMRTLKAGDQFGRLTVIGYEEKSRWRCECTCGNRTVVSTSNLTQGYTRSCGCYRYEVHRTHGLSRHPMYKRWNAMLDRCRNPKRKHFKDYGGRGITVCERWQSFDLFYADVGDAPPGMTLDRVDVDKGYEPGNVRWATGSTQAKNKRSRKSVVLQNISIGELEAVLAAKKEAALGVFA